MSNFIQNIAASLFGLYTKEDVKKKIDEATKQLNIDINNLKEENNKLKIENQRLSSNIIELQNKIKKLQELNKKEYTITFSDQDKVYYVVDNKKVTNSSIKLKEGKHTVAAYNVSNNKLADNIYIDFKEKDEA